MTKASYRLYITKNFGDANLIRFDNRYKGANHSIIYEPKMLAWVNNTDLSDMQVFRNQQNVQGTYDNVANNLTICSEQREQKMGQVDLPCWAAPW